MEDPLPESIVDVKEFCSNCGRILVRGSSFIRATIEQVTTDDAGLFIDSDKRYFCKDCLRGGICINFRSPEPDPQRQ